MSAARSDAAAPEHDRDGARPAELLVAGAWVGLAAGIVEVIAVHARALTIGPGVTYEPHELWMRPASLGVVTVGVAAALAAIARLLRRGLPYRPAVFMLAAVGLSSVLLVFSPQLHPAAAAVLACGAAVQVARVVGRRRLAFRPVARRTLPWMGAAVALTAAAVHGADAYRERRALSAAPQPRAGAPNVLLVVLDTVRAQSLGLHGNTRDTSPNLVRLAREGVTFDRAVATASWTLPSHASMFTGRRPNELSTGWDKALDDTHPTLAETLSAHGYASGGFAANRAYCRRGTGLGRGFAHYDAFPVTPGAFVTSAALPREVERMLRDQLRHVFPSPLVQASDVTETALEWIDEHRDRPFFVFLNWFDAHGPYAPPPPFDTAFGLPRPDDPAPGTRVPALSDPAELARHLAQYEGCVAHLDAQLGRLLDALRTRDLLDETVVVVTSDHGEEFAEHEVMTHGVSLYMPSLHVPLVVRAPTGTSPSAAPRGVIVREPVSLRHIGSTILELAGLPDSAVHFPGSSLSRFWKDGGLRAPGTVFSMLDTHSERPKWWPAGRFGLRSVVVDGFHYIGSEGDLPEHLYRWHDDPWEQRDLARDPAHGDALVRCRAALRDVLGPQR